jgi:hypothetical protein
MFGFFRKHLGIGETDIIVIDQIDFLPSDGLQKVASVKLV